MRINTILQHMSRNELAHLMGINEALAAEVQKWIARWSDGRGGSAAALTFRGDIYSGLSAAQWSAADAAFAQKHLLILSGLYGLLRPFDAIKPYRLEMGCGLMVGANQRLDAFWGERLAGALDVNDTYINLTAKEYFKVVQRQLSNSRVISPKFLTVSKKTGQPTFVTVHAKIARGSFANWLIRHRIDDPDRITDYDQLNYAYNKGLSTATEPVFVCREFGGLGLSVRLK